jgi:hypothetical protein
MLSSISCFMNFSDHDLTQALEGMIKDQLSTVVSAVDTERKERAAFESKQEHMWKAADDLLERFSLTDSEVRAFKNQVIHCNTDSSTVAGTISRYIRQHLSMEQC